MSSFQSISTWPGWAGVAATVAAIGVVAGFIQLSLMRRQMRIQEQQHRQDYERSQTPLLALEVLNCRYEDGVHCFDCRLHADGSGTANYVQINVWGVGDKAHQVAGGLVVPFVRTPGQQDFELLVGGLGGGLRGETLRIEIKFMNRFRKVYQTTYEGLFFGGIRGEADPELRLIGAPKLEEFDFILPKRPGHMRAMTTGVWAWWMRRRGYVSLEQYWREIAKTFDEVVV
jgi:hypothetical protein